MTLSRSDLEQGRMRELYAAAADPGHALDEEALAASLTATLRAKPKGAGWWVFAYGSLLWNPIFPVVEQCVATIHGWHRRFCLKSLAARGTREQPGLVLGLKPGGACRGVALRLPAPLALDELKLLWRREMVVGSYKPVWVRANAGERTITALAFTVKRDHPQYAHLTLAQEARVIATACGAFGSSCDYLMHTRNALAGHGIVDRYLETVAGVVARSAGSGAGGGASEG